MSGSSSPRVPRGPREVDSNSEPRLERHDPAALADALLTTYRATGMKRLAPRLGYADPSMLYKQTEMVSSDELDLGELTRTVERNPADMLVRAILNARREHAPEERAAAVLYEICRQCGYERPERSAESSGCLIASVGHHMAAAGEIAVELNRALEDGEISRNEARVLAEMCERAIEQAKKLRSLALGMTRFRPDPTLLRDHTLRAATVRETSA